MKVLITGANRGIGLALAQAHARRGDSVHATVRNESPALRETGASIHAGIDLREDAAIAGLAAAVAGQRFDRLMLNAGILRVEALADFDAASAQRVAEQFALNALAPLRLVAALRGNFAPGARIGLITSRMGSIADNGSGGYYGYRMSKAALNAAGRSLALDLREAGIAVFLLHPGFVRTEMTGGQGDRSADEAAAGLIERMDTLGLGDTGSFWHANGMPLPW